jgi:hypothetical protein
MVPLRRSHLTIGPRPVEADRFGTDPHNARLPTSEPSQKDEFPTFLRRSSRILPTFPELKKTLNLYLRKRTIFRLNPKFSDSAKLKEKKPAQQTN